MHHDWINLSSGLVLRNLMFWKRSENLQFENTRIYVQFGVTFIMFYDIYNFKFFPWLLISPRKITTWTLQTLMEWDKEHCKLMLFYVLNSEYQNCQFKKKNILWHHKKRRKRDCWKIPGIWERNLERFFYSDSLTHMILSGEPK